MPERRLNREFRPTNEARLGAGGNALVPDDWVWGGEQAVGDEHFIDSERVGTVIRGD
jgi:hypothetical protein